MSATRRRFGLAAAGGAVLLAAAPLRAQGSDEAAVAHAVEALREAMLAPDRARLAALVSDHLSYGHSAGRVENKAQFIDALVNRTSIFHAITLSDQSIALSGDAAVVRHVLVGDTESGGRRVPVRIGVLMVWQKQAGHWRLLARQAVALPA
ncbi:nuclear transport factor 2 family protein [Roseomonas sp. NAR14]|uniref:Nuclear transport factor 2 family protein n=1 Tax=Roseomonas acroporae TaxID=2937791 RepID=A0A9X2BT83_9PROT|nr:nuclear transport factor 2 family protein [Roseomonas acroporae]MCK8783972.1 nuclear transport factor 2 family protein [Roseomonas acroporae]